MKDRHGNEWVMVPCEATPEMWDAAYSRITAEYDSVGRTVFVGVPDAIAAAIAAAPKFEAVEVTQEMCWMVWQNIPKANEDDPRAYLAAWRAELGPALGLVEMREPTQEEGEAIYKHWEHAATGCRPLCQSGRDMFNAVRAVMWPKEGL